MSFTRIRSFKSLPTPINKILQRFSQNLSSISAAASVPYPIPRDASSRSLPAHQEVMWKLDWSASHIHARVMLMIKLSNLDAAADQARLTVLARGRSSSRTCDAIIGAMCRAGRYADAFDYFNYFFNVSNLKPNISCCNHIIGALLLCHGVDEAIRFYRHLLVVDSHHPNEETYSLLAKGLVDAGRIKEAENLIMSSEAECHLSPLVFNHLIRGFLDQGKLETALQVFSDLKQRVVSSVDDQVSDLIHFVIDEDYNGIAMVNATFIEYWFKQGNDSEATKCYTSLLDKLFVMDANTGNTLLRILLNHGKKTQAWALFDHRLQKGHHHHHPVQINADTCNIMVNECFRNSSFNEAVDTFQRVVTTINGPQLCYRNIISQFCQHGMLSEAETFFQDMCSKQFIIPDIPSYRLLLDAYANAARFDDATRIANLAVDAYLKCIAKFCPL
ncbi:PREDICTED: pentatricopeptide repeat-containing protein At1g10270-like [Camelina sativa]|uniref:Pentatricopeptide repeat-containing protein At1g10270-like n=1 Tax=Camelina sativa TaxID=90675 RepID=A0ABM0T060_CAMSA|nr:PREDICTED: pentatricopeptide repeat-containing protein At1g10270-like [Camelina sativa]